MSARRQGILVAGMHRSGTSALSGSLQRLGVSLGDHLIPGASDNPKGYFEHAGVVAIHEALFRELGSWWYDPRPLPAGWLDTPAARRAEEALAKLLRADFDAAALWAVKDPRLCRFIPLWRKVLDRLAMPAAAMLVVRAPGEVAASLTARNGFGAELGELLWLRHVLDSVRDTEGLSRAVILYEDLVADPRPAIDAALGRMGLAVPGAAPADALAGFVETRFQHHEQDDAAALASRATLAGRVFASLRGLAHGNAGWDAMSAHLEEFARLWDDIGPAMTAMADALFPEIEAKARLAEEVFAVRAELNGQLRWAEDVLAQHRAQAEQHERGQLALAGERDALQAALAHARSDLTAQVRWAETVMGERDEQRGLLTQQRDEAQAALAQARSDLAAQVRWAEAMIAQRDDLRATLAQQRDDAYAALALAREDLAAQQRLSADTLEQHRTVLAELHAQAERDRLQAERDCDVIEALRLHERELALLKNGWWWRLSRPFRGRDESR